MFRVVVNVSKKNEIDVEIIPDSFRNDYELAINVSPDTSLASLFSDRKKIVSMIKEKSSSQLEEMMSLGLDEDGFFDDKKSFDDFFLMELADNDISLSEIEKSLDGPLLFSFFGSDLHKYIDNNIEFLNENGVTLPSGSHGISLSTKSLDSLLSEYPNVKNPYILLQGNVSSVPVEAARDTINYINGVCEHVKGLELSPLEEVIYVFDQIRQREYSEELDGESYEKSRGLSDIILGNKIVCAGYSNLYITILKNLGHNITELPLDSDINKGHSRVIIKLDDDKYDIHGIFASDPTWSSKDEEDPDYLDSYSFFLRRPSYFRNLDSTFGLHNIIENTDEINDFISEYKQNYSIIDYVKWMSKYRTLISTIPRLCGDENLIEMPTANAKMPTKKEFYSMIKHYFEMFNKNPNIPQLMRAINTVREIEHQDNPEISAGREAMERIFDRYDSGLKDRDETMKFVFGERKPRNKS